MMNVGAVKNERLGRVAEGLAILFEFEDIVVNIIAVIEGHVAVDRLGSPDLGWYVNDKGAGKRGGWQWRFVPADWVFGA